MVPGALTGGARFAAFCEHYIRRTKTLGPITPPARGLAVLLAIVARYMDLTDEDLAILGPVALIVARVVVRVGVFSAATLEGFLEDEDEDEDEQGS